MAERDASGRFLGGNQAARKPVRRCVYCNQPIQGRKDAKFCCESHKVMFHQMLERYKLLSVKKTD